MKKYIVSIIFPAVLCLFLYGCGENDTAGKKVLNLAEYNDEDNIITRFDYEFAKLVEEKSDGTLAINVHPNGEQGTDKEALDKVLSGDIDIANINMSSLGEKSKTAREIDLPFLFRNSGHMWRAVSSAAGPKINLELASENGQILSYMYPGAKSIYFKNPVSKEEDFKNLNIVGSYDSELSSNFFSMLEAKYKKLDENKVSDALKNNSIDGAENTLSGYYKYGDYKHAPNFLKIEYKHIPNIIIINKNVYDSLTEKEQNIISSAASEASIHQRNAFEEYEKQIEQKLIEQGCKITAPSSELMETFKRYAEIVFKEVPRGDTEFTMLEQLRATK